MFRGRRGISFPAALVLTGVLLAALPLPGSRAIAPIGRRQEVVIVVCKYKESPDPQITAGRWARALDEIVNPYFLEASEDRTNFRFLPIAGTCKLEDTYRETRPENDPDISSDDNYSITNDPETIPRDVPQAIDYAADIDADIWDHRRESILVFVGDEKRARAGPLSLALRGGVLFKTYQAALMSEPRSGHISTSDAATVAHEMGHMLGLNDYYKEGSTNDDYFEFWDLMGYDNFQALSGLSRYKLGWIENDQIEPIFVTPSSGVTRVIEPTGSGGDLELVLLPVGAAPLQTFGGYTLEVRPGDLDLPSPVEDEDGGLWYQKKYCDGRHGLPLDYEPGVLVTKVNRYPWNDEKEFNPATVMRERDESPECPPSPPIAFHDLNGVSYDIFGLLPGDRDRRLIVGGTADSKNPSRSSNGDVLIFDEGRQYSGEADLKQKVGSSTTELVTSGTYAGNGWQTPDNDAYAYETNEDGDHEVYIATDQGPSGFIPTKLTDNVAFDGRASISPDGSRIAFVSDRDGNLEIYVVNSDGTNLQRLTNNPGADDNPAWSPDGESIAFDSELDGSKDIYVLHLATVEDEDDRLFAVTQDPIADSAPAWSPDGAYLLFQRRGPDPGIYSVGADGDTEIVRLVDGSAPNWGSVSYSTQSQLGDATLQVGENFTDAAAGITVTVTRADPPGYPDGSFEVRVTYAPPPSPDLVAADMWLDNPANGFDVYETELHDGIPEHHGDPVFLPTEVRFGSGGVSVKQTTTTHRLNVKVDNEGDAPAADVKGRVYFLGPQIPAGLEVINPSALADLSIYQPQDVSFGDIAPGSSGRATVDVAPAGPFVAVLWLEKHPEDGEPLNDLRVEGFVHPQFAAASPYQAQNVKFDILNLNSTPFLMYPLVGDVPSGWAVDVGLLDDPERSYAFFGGGRNKTFSVRIKPPATFKPGIVTPLDLVAMMNLNDSYIPSTVVPIYAVTSRATKLSLSKVRVEKSKAIIEARFVDVYGTGTRPVVGERIVLSLTGRDGSIRLGGPSDTPLVRTTNSSGRARFTFATRKGVRYGAVAHYAGSLMYESKRSAILTLP